jgi:phosphoglycerate dehydrogenase-like enzyme
MASWCHEELVKRMDVPHDFTVIADPRRIGDFTSELAAAEAIVGWPLTHEILVRCPRLRLVQAAGAGVDGIDFGRIPPGVRVANTFHHEVAIAEYVIMAMLMLSRKAVEHDLRLRRGIWDGSCIWGETPVLGELYGQSLLLIGLGHIARETAVRARAFGMRILGASRNPSPPGPWDRVIAFASWESLLPEADWVVPCCPLTPQTSGLIGAAQIARMKPSAHLINMTRGKVLDESAVFDALRTRRIAGAALDVWYRYPSDPAETCLPSNLPFHELPNVLLSPHNSAWTMRTIMGRVADIAANLNRLARGDALLNVLH